MTIKNTFKFFLMTRNMKIKFSGEKCLHEFLKVTSELKSYFRAKKHTDHKTHYTGNRRTNPLAAFFMKFARRDIHSLTAFLCIFAIKVLLNI